MFFYHSACKNCCLNINIQKIALQAESETCFQIWFFPKFGGGGTGGVLSMRMQVILDSSFRSPGFSLYMGRAERRVQGLDYEMNGCKTLIERTVIELNGVLIELDKCRQGIKWMQSKLTRTRSKLKGYEK